MLMLNKIIKVREWQIIVLLIYIIKLTIFTSDSIISDLALKGAYFLFIRIPANVLAWIRDTLVFVYMRNNNDEPW